MATGTKFQSAVEAVFEGKHNLGTGTLKVLLSNVAPNAATNTVKADITEITPGNGYTAGGAAITVTSSAQSSGTYKLIGNDVVFTASGGSMAAFRYLILYNDSAANDELLGYWDNGSSVTLASTETYTLDFSAVAGIIQAS